MNWIITLSLIASLIGVASAERVEIRPGKTFCFFEDLQVGQNYGVQFQSDEGEFHVYIVGPSGVIYDTSKDTYGSFNFPAKIAGRYEVCFENNLTGGSQARKISFNELGSGKGDGSKEKLDPAQVELRDLNTGLRSVRDEQEYLLDREIIHKQIAEATNKRVFYWFIFQVGLLASISYFQIYYLKRFFEVRRVV